MTAADYRFGGGIIVLTRVNIFSYRSLARISGHFWKRSGLKSQKA